MISKQNLKDHMKITFAEKCAWRAMYVKVGHTQVFYIGVDPNNGVKPKLFGGIAVGSWYSWLKPHGFNFRLTLPWVGWTGSTNPVRMYFYKKLHSFWFAVDGRYTNSVGKKTMQQP